jgi:hypothetical protein
MESTLEIRWFREGAPPSRVVDWIRSLGAETAPTRKDLYLVTAKPEMNIKMREGMAQVKLRFADERSGRYSGTVEEMEFSPLREGRYSV